MAIEIDAPVENGAAPRASHGKPSGSSGRSGLSAGSGPGGQDERSGRGRRGPRRLGLIFIGAGLNHFVMPRPYRQIVPPSMGDASTRATLVTVSGVAEIAGGVGVLLPRTRRLAGFGLIALLAAVFPANLYMARNPSQFHRIP
ncbi:MAG: hypothetical protein WB709_10870, partial [Solirubrobacteraceae bacterium]